MRLGSAKERRGQGGMKDDGDVIDCGQKSSRSLLMLARWWFQIFFIFPPDLGKISNLTNMFHLGLNHQLVGYCCIYYTFYSAFPNMAGEINMFFLSFFSKNPIVNYVCFSLGLSTWNLARSDF